MIVDLAGSNRVVSISSVATDEIIVEISLYLKAYTRHNGL